MQSPCRLQPQLFADFSCGLKRFPIYSGAPPRIFIYCCGTVGVSLFCCVYNSRNSLWKYTLKCEQPVPCFRCNWRQTGLRELNAWNKIHMASQRTADEILPGSHISLRITGFVGLAGFICSLTLNAFQLEFLSSRCRYLCLHMLYKHILYTKLLLSCQIFVAIAK